GQLQPIFLGHSEGQAVLRADIALPDDSPLPVGIPEGYPFDSRKISLPVGRAGARLAVIARLVDGPLDAVGRRGVRGEEILSPVRGGNERGEPAHSSEE